MPTPKFILSVLARAARGTAIVDRGYRVFDRLRSKLVLRCASDAFYEVYNEVTYASQKIYRTGNVDFREALFPFEERAISQHFPAPPRSVLVGGAGGGREAFALARRGYEVIAFEPVLGLVTMIERNRGELPVEALVGRYEDLPIMQSPAQPPAPIDLRSREPFAAAIMGWGSFSHIRSDKQCVEALRQISYLTRGPILISYLHPGYVGGVPAAGFTPIVGFFRTFSGEGIRSLAELAELKVIHLDEDNWPHAVLHA